jgi:hypothetical protein
VRGQSAVKKTPHDLISARMLLESLHPEHTEHAEFFNGPRTSRYARLLPLVTRRRQLAPVDTRQLAHQLTHAAQISVHRLYRTILQAQELNKLTASKAHPTETLRYHLLGVANWVLFLLRTRSHEPLAVSAALTGEPGETPGPVEMEDRPPTHEP